LQANDAVLFNQQAVVSICRTRASGVRAAALFRFFESSSDYRNSQLAALTKIAPATKKRPEPIGPSVYIMISLAIRFALA
jgi:hypothetical protein